MIHTQSDTSFNCHCYLLLPCFIIFLHTQPTNTTRLLPCCFTYLQQVLLCSRLHSIVLFSRSTQKRGFNSLVAYFLYIYLVMRIALLLDHVIPCSVCVCMEDILLFSLKTRLYIYIYTYLQYILLQ